jgi:Tol biopolymer transport system component
MQTISAAATLAALLCVASSSTSIHTLAQHDRLSKPMDPSSAAVSADGRYVAFASYASLVPADTNSRRDVYVLDRRDGRVTLESVTAAGGVGDVDSGHPRISGDGRWLVFETGMPSPGARAVWDVVLRDRREGTVAVVSLAPGGARANGVSSRPAISQDGRVVAFSSTATNLVSGPDANGGGEDVYVFDAKDGALSRISVDVSGAQPAIGTSVTPTTSADGRYIAFASTADLERAGRDRKPLPGIFVRDRLTNVTTRVDRRPGQTQPDGSSWAPAMGADGRHVAFVSNATTLAAADGNRSPDVFLADLVSGSIELVSRNARSGSPANGPSGNPVLSADGRFVAFQSEASDMLCARCTTATEDINLLWDIFLLDRRAGTIARVSGDTTGGWMAPSTGPAVDGGADLVVFSSRHPIDASDTANDLDLFLCAAAFRAAGRQPAWPAFARPRPST